MGIPTLVRWHLWLLSVNPSSTGPVYLYTEPELSQHYAYRFLSIQQGKTIITQSPGDKIKHVFFPISQGCHNFPSSLLMKSYHSKYPGKSNKISQYFKCKMSHTYQPYSRIVLPHPCVLSVFCWMACHDGLIEDDVKDIFYYYTLAEPPQILRQS